MKVTCVLGSPREEGNSSKIAARLCSSMQAKGAETRIFFLNKLRYVGCQSCMACKDKSEVCVIKDDLTEVLSDVKSSDVIILASPIFFGDVSGQLKCFIDRSYSYLTLDYKSRLIPGKKLVMVLSQGNPDSKRYGDVFIRYDEFFQWHKFKSSHLIRSFYSPEKKGTPLEEPLRQAEQLAAKFMAGA